MSTTFIPRGGVGPEVLFLFPSRVTLDVKIVTPGVYEERAGFFVDLAVSVGPGPPTVR